MIYEKPFFKDCAVIQRECRHFVGALQKQLSEYDMMLRTLRGEDLYVMQGKAQELARILDLLDDADTVVQQMR